MNNNNILLEAQKGLKNTRKVVENIPKEMYNMAERMADKIKDEQIPLTPFELVLLLANSIEEIEDETEKLWTKRHLKHFPLIVDKMASEKFSEEFRDIFEDAFKIKAIEKITTSYSCEEIKPNYFSIKGKNKAELLKNLYNIAKIKDGFGTEYMYMSLELAERFLEEDTYFETLMGKDLDIDLSQDEVYVGAYNKAHGKGKAQKAISMSEDIKIR